LEIRYTGARTQSGCEVRKEEKGKESEPLDLRLDLWNHSPTGHEWGYGGSGPAQLALALLADATGDDRLAVALHQEFKWKFVGSFPREGFSMTAEEIQHWAKEAAKNLDLSPWEDDLEEGT
jgi:hypothetical protein